MRGLAVAAILLAAPLALAGSISEVLNSTNPNVSFANNTGFAIDNMSGVEVVERAGDPSGWVWPVIDITFPATTIDAGAQLQLDARYHQEDYPLPDDQTRAAYGDANMWVLLYPTAGGEIDLGWIGHWDADGWQTMTADLSAYAGTEVNSVQVRSTNWDAPNPNNDYFHFSHCAITPEPGAIALLSLGLLGVLRRR